MKRILVVLVALVALGVGIADASPVNRVRASRQRTNWGSAVQADSATFAIETGTANACTDTLTPVYIGDMNFVPTPGGSSNIACLRLLVYGTANAATTDTLYAYPEFATSPNGPWAGTGATVVPPLTLLEQHGASGAPTGTNQAVFTTELPNVAPTTFTGLSARYWKYLRLRINGDHTSGALLSNASAEIVISTDDAPGNTDRN